MKAMPLEAFSELNGIGAVAIMKDGNVVYEGVSGYMDAGYNTVSNVMMRVASVSKSVTAAAVRQLAWVAGVGCASLRS